jgi:hypothetical protein
MREGEVNTLALSQSDGYLGSQSSPPPASFAPSEETVSRFVTRIAAPQTELVEQ